MNMVDTLSIQNECRNLKLAETHHKEREQGRMKKIRGDEPVGVIIQIYMEIP
jgi:hypothetical protein